MHAVVRVRIFLARHPWWYWLAVAALATVVAILARDRLAEVDRNRNEWGASRAVIVADADHEPGDELRVSSIDLPTAAIPPTALVALPTDARLRQRVAAGEIVVATDIADSDGPAARASAGTVVVGVIDPTAPVDQIGVAVRIVADGVVLADRGTVVELSGEVVYVAVDASSAPVVAAAAQQRVASILFLP
jgi:hypothetical protein